MKLFPVQLADTASIVFLSPTFELSIIKKYVRNLQSRRERESRMYYTHVSVTRFMQVFFLQVKGGGSSNPQKLYSLIHIFSPVGMEYCSLYLCIS